MNFYKPSRFFWGCLFLIINTLGCKQDVVGGLSAFIPEDASKLLVIQQVKEHDLDIPAFVRPWAEILGPGPCLLAHCPVGIGLEEWLMIAPAGGREKPFPFHQHPKVRVIRHLAYSGHEIYVLDVPSVGQVTFAFAGSVLFCSPRTLLVEEALERKRKNSTSWTSLLRGEEFTGPVLFWDSRHSEPILPRGVPPEGFLRAPHQPAADASWRSFPFVPRAKIYPGAQRPFPMALAGLVPEDVAVFDWPFSLDSEKGDHLAWRRFFAPWAKSDPGFARLPGQDSSVLVILEASGSAETVSRRLKAYAEHFGILKSYLYQSFRIVQVMDQSVPELLSMPSNRPVCLLELEGYVLLSNRPEALERWADFYRIGAMLDRKLGLNPGALTGRAVSWRYLSPFQPVPDWLSSWLPGFPAALSWLGKEGTDWRWNVAPVGIEGSKPQPQGNILWRITLPLPVRRFFPLSGSAVVAVQDEASQLYFLDQSNGGILWNKKLDGPLLSEVFPVHIPSLDQRGWLMNTRSAVYLFSEEGHLAAGYPLLLRAPASAGLTFVPGMGGKGGAYFFPSENRRIYGYSLEGMPLSVWSPGPEAGDMATPLVCFPYAGKDYIAGYSSLRGFFALNPLGEDHFQPVGVQVEGFPAPVADPTSSTPRFVVFDGRGRAQVINLQGAHFPLRVAASPGLPSQSLFSDFAGDPRKDFLSLQGKQLQLSGYEEKTFRVFWSQQLETPADTLILVDKPGKKWAALGRAKSRTLHLFDGAGNEVPGSPVGGSQGLKWTDGGGAITVLGNQIIAYQLPKPD